MFVWGGARGGGGGGMDKGRGRGAWSHTSEGVGEGGFGWSSECVDAREPRWVVSCSVDVHPSMAAPPPPSLRYCPSIEDKIVRFADKESHQIFLEPEGRNTPELYVQVGTVVRTVHSN